MPREHPYYPLFIDVEGRRVVIVGGGTVAARKAEALARYGARVIVVSPDASDEMQALIASRAVSWRQKRFEEADVAGALLVVASTNNSAVNALAADAARRRGIPVNVADAPELCDFTVPAVVEVGSIQIAVSTGGRSPALARRLRQDLEDRVGREYATMNEVLGSLREPAIASPALPRDADRRRFFQEVIDCGALDLFREGKDEEAYARIRDVCERSSVPLPDGFGQPAA